MPARDTDADWELIARVQPYFGVLARPEFRTESIDDAARARFFESGRGDIGQAIDVIRAHLDPTFAPAAATDFGSGAGRLTLAMAAYAGHVVGVDVAPAMRDLAAEQAAAQGVGNVEFTDTVPARADWVNSLIVFQHIPPARGHLLLDELLASVTVGGVASLQFGTHRDRDHLHEVFRDVALARFDGATMTTLATSEETQLGDVSMFDYDLGRLASQFVAHGFENLWLEHTYHGGVHGFWIFARRATVPAPAGAPEDAAPAVVTASEGSRVRRWLGRDRDRS
jgi:SAM-dependent methyltransferase